MAQEDDTELTDRQERTALLALELCPQFPVSEVNYQAGSLGCQSSRFNTYWAGMVYKKKTQQYLFNKPVKKVELFSKWPKNLPHLILMTHWGFLIQTLMHWSDAAQLF